MSENYTISGKRGCVSDAPGCGRVGGFTKPSYAPMRGRWQVLLAPCGGGMPRDAICLCEGTEDVFLDTMGQSPDDSVQEFLDVYRASDMERRAAFLALFFYALEEGVFIFGDEGAYERYSFERVVDVRRVS